MRCCYVEVTAVMAGQRCPTAWPRLAEAFLEHNMALEEATEVRCSVETRVEIAWVPARPERLTGRSWQELEAAWSMTWR